MSPRTWSGRSCWLVAVVSAVFAPILYAGVRPGVMLGGGGVDADPPMSPAGNLGSFTTPVDEVVQLPLLVDVDGPLTSYTLAVTAPGGAVVAVGTTGEGGLARLAVPAMPGLELDVVGTGVVGVPVQGGQTVSITIP